MSGHRAAARAQAAADRQAVLARQHEIEDDEIGPLAGKHLVERRAALSHLHREALADQQIAHQALNLLVVFDKDNQGVGGRRHGRHGTKARAKSKRDMAPVTRCYVPANT
jgi:hypothetical protein